MVLASSREGWANVLLESMACGTPEIVQNKDAGVLVKRTAEEIAAGVDKLFSNYPARNDTRKYALSSFLGTVTAGVAKAFCNYSACLIAITKMVG